MKIVWIIAACLVAAAINLQGCGPLDKLKGAELVGLTPEQAVALDAAGQAHSTCIMAGGPPGAGSVVVVTFPKTAKGTLSFGPDCHGTASFNVGE